MFRREYPLTRRHFTRFWTLCSPPKTETKLKKSKIPKTSSTKSSDSPLMSESPTHKSQSDRSYETQLRQLKASIKTNNKPSPENVHFEMPTTSSSGIPGVGGSPPHIPPVAAVVSAPEKMTFTDPFSEYSPAFKYHNQLIQMLINPKYPP